MTRVRKEEAKTEEGWVDVDGSRKKLWKQGHLISLNDRIQKF